MKLPKTFRPDKELDKKIEELKQGTKSLSGLQELTNMVEIREFLADGGLSEGGLRDYLEQEIFPEIIQYTYDGLVRWKKVQENNATYRAKTLIMNTKGDIAIVPIRIIIYDTAERPGALNIGEEPGLSINTYNDGLKELITKYFGEIIGSGRATTYV
ncbi:MAG: hypothetical protein L6408_03290 [Nanoarchaeota archaeon]|nr:hypothetical protein [Nanoarchaeota archaeon]